MTTPPTTRSLTPAEMADVAETVRRASRRAMSDLILIGQLLLRVRAALPRGGFLPWVDAELGWSRATAYRLMDVAQAFAGLTPSQAEKFSPTALYALALPGVPPAAREYAVELAAGGEAVTARVAADLVARHRQTGRPPAPSLAARAAAVGPVPDAPAWAVALRDLVAEADMVHLTRAVDEETGEEYFCGRLYRGGSAHPETAAADSVEEVLVRLAGREESRRCPRCGAAKAMGEFRRNRWSSKGREHQCRECAKKRQAARRAKRKAAQEA